MFDDIKIILVGGPLDGKIKSHNFSQGRISTQYSSDSAHFDPFLPLPCEPTINVVDYVVEKDSHIGYGVHRAFAEGETCRAACSIKADMMLHKWWPVLMQMGATFVSCVVQNKCSITTKHGTYSFTTEQGTPALDLIADLQVSYVPSKGL